MAHQHPSPPTPDGPRTGPIRTLALDDLFDVLGSDWRRRAVRQLAGRESAETVDAFVADLLSEHEPTGDHDQMRIAFHHSHLPKLADLDIVVLDDGTVAPGTNLGEAVACLDAVRETRA